ncbi:MAG: hypothetical protein JSU92_00580 [Deltaproteobacteria bacterium]|nr:MAG: hypothetical protein JSU92_00580 [Deltaproteobacteria bacterium]
MAKREPELYVKLDRDDISFEVPGEKIIEFIDLLARELKATEIELRYEVDSHSKRLSCKPEELTEKLLERKKIVREEPMVIELEEDTTLYSNGGGCMLLKTGIDSRRKKRLAQHFLELCGFSAEVESAKFTALVMRGELEVITK